MPYLYKVPREIIPYKKLLSTCGVREQFEVNDFINVLEELSHKRREHPLEPPECKIALTLLRELCEKTSSSVDLEDKDIYVPDNNDVLRSSKVLTFNDDAPWLQQNGHYTFAHKDVPWSHAEKLGIVAARYKKAQEFSSLMGFAHEFGQKEELTNRLKDILKAYPGGSEIFKELLQNADDAKATEIHIIYDQRSHPSQMIVSDSWATMQERPAICVYNNRVFSDEDIKGIQQVGIGGKRSDAETTGQYGIGFNSVYHLTDCPTFISDNEKLGIFDPHLKYITGASVNKPGILFDPVSELQSSFKHMLSGYLGDFIKLEGGTLFRFPLRQEGDASDISSSTYGPSDVRELIRQFQSNAFDSLMFLNHIKTIKLSEITISGELKQLYMVGVEMTESDTLKREDMAKHISQHKNTTVVEIPVKVTDYLLSVKDSKHREEDWLIVQQFGFSERPDEHLAHEDIGKLLPRAGVAAMVSEHTPVATKYPSYIRPGMSSPAPAAKEMTKQKYAYCFLPLPIETDLPVNVNGHFALDRSRRYLWRDQGHRHSFRGAWNEQLISKALAPAYSTLLSVAAQKYVVNLKEDSDMDEVKSKDLEWYHGLFPLVQKGVVELTGTRKWEWTFLAEQTMVYIASMRVKVLPMIKHSGLDEAVISWHEPVNEDNSVFFDSLGRGNTGKLIRSFLMASGFNLLASPMRIYDSFLHLGIKVHTVTPVSIVEFMHSNSCAVGNVPCGIDLSTYKTVKSYLKVLKYVLKCIKDPRQLSGLPLQLCADNTVGVFRTCDPPYLSEFTDLLPSLKHKFLSPDTHSILLEFMRGLDSSTTVNAWKDLTPHELSQHLNSVLPDEWENVPHCITLLDVPNKDFYIQWLQLLWKYLCTRTDDDPLHHLQSWPIIPITESSLLSPSNGKHVLNLLSREDEWSLQFHVSQLFRKLRCPEVSQEIIENEPCTKERIAELLQPYVVSPEECKDVLSLIDYLMTKRSICFLSISKYEAETFLQYFQKEIKNYSHQHINILKKLPVYEKHSGELTSLYSYSKCHVLSGSFPEVPDGLWNKCSCVFLSPKLHLQLLLQGIGVSAIDVFDVYKMYIIPNFHIFSNQSRVAHLKYIRDKLMPSRLNNKQQEHIIRILSSVELIPSEDGTLKRVDYFFDPKNNVFMEMEDKCYHLPKEFADDYRWGNFLERLGLKTTVTKSLFLQYVNRVATSAIRCTSAALKPILCKSKLLAGELNNNNDLRTPDTFQEISKIKFIPSARVRHDLCDIHPPFLREGTDVVPFICYNGNISEQHVELAWTSCFLLPHWAIPTRYEYIRNKRVDLHQYLGISDKQSLGSVINHCQNICDRMAKENCPDTEDTVPKKTRETLSSVLIKIYKYLQQNINNTPLKTRLSNTPLVLVDNNKMLVRANQLAYKLGPLPSDTLQPYMYTPPRALGQYDELFQQLGTEENATFQQYACVLTSIKERCKDNNMDPNEKKKVLSATKALFHYLSDDTYEKDSESVNRLYLPSATYKLKLSTELYHGSYHLIRRIDQSEYDFLLPLTECGCDERKGNMSVELLPEKHRPKDVGKVVSEKIGPHAKPCIAESCDYSCHFKGMLSSEELALALKRIIRHQRGPNFLDTCRKDQIANLKTKLRIHCMRKLETMIYSPSRGEYIDGSENDQQIFMSESEDGFDLYINHGDIPVEIRLLGKLVTKVNKIISWQVIDTAVVQTLLSKGVEHFEDILSEDYHIPEYDQIDEVKEDESSPGKPVPEDVVNLLNNDPINSFRAGEVVASRKSIQEGDGAESESGEYVFAEVIEVLDVYADSGDTRGRKKKYKVNSGGNEPVEVSCNDLFKFKRFKK
ncbi:sacsin-like [Ptychodera flava]|uniref:sacsin-like n=1 Tax=Ptychodera flava TaxID=63121 RepID=UPI00396A11C3